MARNGTGTWVRIYSWADDDAADIPIRSDRMDGEFDDMAAGLTQSLSKDGQTTPTANLPMGGYKHTGVAVASARTDYLRASQAQDADLVSFTASGTDTYTLTPSPAVTSYTTYQSWRILFTNANLTTSPTLAVSGLTAKAIKKNGSTSLAAGDIAAGSIWWVTYDGTNFVLNGQVYVLPTQPVFQLTVGSAQTTSFSPAVNTRYTLTKSGAVTVTMPASPAVGDVIQLEIGGTSGIVTYDLNGLKYYGSTTNPTSVAEGVQTFVYHSASRGWIDQ